MDQVLRGGSWLWALCSLGSVTSAGVLVVGPAGSGAPFADVQPAIDAAQPGDTVLVLAGSYGTAVIAKPIQLIGAGSNLVTLTGLHTAPVLQITSIPAGETAVVAGFDLQAQFVTFTLPQSLALVTSNAGTVVLQDLVLQDEPLISHKSGELSVSSSELVLIESCLMFGGNGGGIGLATPAISAADSTVWLMNSTVRGGTDDSLPGADAIRCTASTLYLAASDVLGGQGGSPFGCGHAGGDGIFMSGGLLKAVGPEGLVSGGASGGTYSTSLCSPGAGQGGSGIYVTGGAEAIVADSLTVHGGAHDQFLYFGSAPSIVVESGSSLSGSPFVYPTLTASQPTVVGGGGVSLTLRGNPLGLGWFFFGLEVGAPVLFSGVDGAAVLAGGPILLASVPLDLGGFGSLPLLVPANPALVGLVGVFQSLETLAPQAAISNPVFVTISG